MNSKMIHDPPIRTPLNRADKGSLGIDRNLVHAFFAGAASRLLLVLGTFLLLATLATDSRASGPSLISWWPAEGNANDAADGNNGSLFNGAGFAPGKVGQAFALNGYNQRVTVPNAANFQFGSAVDFTVEAWIKLNGPQGDYAGIFANWSNAEIGGTGHGYQLVIVNDRIAAEFESLPLFAGVGNGLIGTTDLNDGQWHHVAMVVTRSSQNAKLYVDGNVEVDVTLAVIGLDLSNPAEIHIGSERFGVPGNNPFFGGEIDEVRLYGSALSASDIQTEISHENDTVPPVISAPANIVAEATGPSGAVVNFSATANDAVSGPVGVTANPPSGSTFPLGTTTVQLSASDAAGNTATASFTITVRDTTAPEILAPVALTAEATSPAGAMVTFIVAANDLVSGNVPVIANPPSGSVFPLGFSTVSLSATDAAGNTATRTIIVKVQDTTPPVISKLTASSVTLWPPNHKMVPITLTAVASDNVGVASLKIISATSNEPDNGLGDGDMPVDIQITGALTLNLRAERSGTGNGRVYTITVEAKDAAGNPSTKTVTVSVPKSQTGK